MSYELDLAELEASIANRARQYSYDTPQDYWDDATRDVLGERIEAAATFEELKALMAWFVSKAAIARGDWEKLG
jgi:elongation factor P--beta-lysine ligase